MALADPTPATPTFCDESTAAYAAEPTMSVGGEQDAGNADVLFSRLTAAMRTTAGDVVVDLSGVEFLGVASVRALLLARGELASDSRSLILRDPSTSAQLTLDLCGVTTHDSLTEPTRSVITGAARAAARRAWAAGTTPPAASAPAQRTS